MAAVAPEPPRKAGPAGDDMGPTIVDRVTKSGRRLFYKLTVIQQPERARACGSGPKCMLESLGCQVGVHC
jgi:hypothetical protein